MTTRKATYNNEEQMMVDMAQAILETHKTGIEATLAKAVIRMMTDKRQRVLDDDDCSTTGPR